MKPNAVKRLVLAGFMVSNLANACPLSEADSERLHSEPDASPITIKAAWSVGGNSAIKVGEPFSITVRACPVNTELLAVEATMPAHRHGMNYQASIEQTAPGHWRVQGMLWHMPGQWQLSLKLRLAQHIQRLSTAVSLR